MENIIHVNIDPILISFGNWVVSWHGFFSFLGVLFAVALVGEWAKDYRVEKEDIFSVTEPLFYELFNKFGNGRKF